LKPKRLSRTVAAGPAYFHLVVKALVIPFNPGRMGIGESLILFFKNFEGMGRRIENATEFCAVTCKPKTRDVAAHQRVFLQEFQALFSEFSFRQKEGFHVTLYSCI